MLPFQFWTNVPIILCAPAQLLFVLLYSLRAFGAGEWWKDFVGRALFIKSVALAYVFVASTWTITSVYLDGLYSGISFDVTDYRAHWAWLIVIGYWLVLFAVYYQLFALIKQRYSPQKRRM